MVVLQNNKFKDLWMRSVYSFVLLGVGAGLFFLPTLWARLIILFMTSVALYEGVNICRKIPGKYFHKGLLFLYICLGCFAIAQFVALSFDMRLATLGTMFVVTIAADIGGYFFGRIIGGWRPFKFISPGKTISGFLGGIFTGIIIGFLWCYYILSYDVFVNFVPIFFLCLLVSVLSQGGDLFQSYFKRLAQIKDSGHILGPHGGVLDRFDSILAVAGIFYLFILSMGEM